MIFASQITVSHRVLLIIVITTIGTEDNYIFNDYIRATSES